MSFVLDTNIVVAALNGDRFGDVKAALRRRGINKSDADLLIAATALETDSVLVTDDRALHDGAIEDLEVENWTA
ncbi:MAG: type II toxin-antitoxin system VapC family toxin [bacterium]|nr:type II toxin-antitoxin system VapC family toxin [bacterium]